MERLHAWVRSLYRVAAFSHGTSDEPIHCRWVDHHLRTHERTWKNYAEFVASI